MYRRIEIPKKRLIKVNDSDKGEELRTILSKRTETTDMKTTLGSRPLAYGERKYGVLPEGNPRTDPWDLMQKSFEEKSKLGRDLQAKEAPNEEGKTTLAGANTEG